MAKITAGFGTSHTPMLNSPAEDFTHHATIDRSGRSLIDKDGRKASYEALERAADPAVLSQIAPEVLRERAARCQAGIAQIAARLQDTKLDALIVVGDDQYEQFFDSNMPAVSIFWGEAIPNNVLPLPPDAPAFWRRARSQYHEPAGIRHYPVASDLARHLIGFLVEHDFDVSVSNKLPFERGEGHAFGFVHRRLMAERPIPIVPVALNTYFPPNQLYPGRCYELGQALRDAVEAWPNNARVGILASGGLSHFVVDEALDTSVLSACRTKDRDAFAALPPAKLQSGSSEIRNWIVAAGAAEGLDSVWQDYIPCYRSPAGTGTGVAFAAWADRASG